VTAFPLTNTRTDDRAATPAHAAPADAGGRWRLAAVPLGAHARPRGAAAAAAGRGVAKRPPAPPRGRRRGASTRRRRRRRRAEGRARAAGEWQPRWAPRPSAAAGGARPPPPVTGGRQTRGGGGGRGGGRRRRDAGASAASPPPPPAARGGGGRRRRDGRGRRRRRSPLVRAAVRSGGGQRLVPLRHRHGRCIFLAFCCFTFDSVGVRLCFRPAWLLGRSILSSLDSSPLFAAGFERAAAVNALTNESY